MADLTFLARFVLTLLVSAVSLLVYKWMQTTTPPSLSPSLPSSTKRSKKRSKKPKKSATKATALDASSSPSTSATRGVPVVASAAPAAATSGVAEDDDESDSHSDEGLSAAQVLATRTFQPKSLGGKIVQTSVSLSGDSEGFAPDQEVLARFRGGERWFPARVLERRKGNEYHLKYDDGEVEYRVPAALIKLQMATATEDKDNRDEGDAPPALVTDAVASAKVAVQQEEEEKKSDFSSSTSEDDGWQVVGTSKTTKQRQVRRIQADAPAEPLVDGLTKRQRENRRKKERQREKKELLRQHAQKDDLDARARWRYVPS